MKLTYFWRLLPAVLLSACLWLACDKDPDPLISVPDQTVTASFLGRVIDEQNQPVAGASVKAGTETRITDLNGVFIFKNLAVKQHHAYFQVSKNGYFTGGRLMSVTAGNTHMPTIQLLKQGFSGLAFSASQGGTYSLPGNGPSLKFPANAFTDGTASYTGAVQIAAKHIDPAGASFAFQVPGSLLGRRADGLTEEVLSSFGMIYVELRGNAGQTLEIAAGKTVEITMPIPAAQLASAPASIPLWHFDEADGLWKEEGSAQKQGNTYVGTVSHFSCWNYDGSLPSINISGQVVDQNGQPVVGVHVWIEETGTGWNIGHGDTDNDGAFSGPVAKDKQLTLKVLDYTACGSAQPAYTANIGPFSADAVLPPIVITLSGVNSVTISADLRDCNDLPITNGYLSVRVNNYPPKFLVPDASGHVQSSMVVCNAAQVKLTAVNVADLTQSLTYTFPVPPTTIAAGTMTACGLVTDYIQYNLDGQDYTVLDVSATSQDSIIYIGGYSPTDFIDFNFTSNNNQPGTYPLNSLYVSGLTDSLGNSTNILTNLIQFGENTGDPVIGTFSGDFQEFGGTIHTISGSYNLKHN